MHYTVYMLLKILERLGRKRVILDRESQEPYLTRYYLFLKDRKWFPFNIFLHNFHKSDPDDLHDHPWPFITIPLQPNAKLRDLCADLRTMKRQTFQERDNLS